MANRGPRILFLRRRLLRRLSRQLGRFPSISAFLSLPRTHDLHLQLQLLLCSTASARLQTLLTRPAACCVSRTPSIAQTGWRSRIWRRRRPDLAAVTRMALLLLGASRSGGIVEGCQGGPRARRHLWWSKPAAAWLAVINPPASLSRYKRPLFGLN